MGISIRKKKVNAAILTFLLIKITKDIQIILNYRNNLLIKVHKAVAYG